MTCTCEHEAIDYNHTPGQFYANSCLSALRLLVLVSLYWAED
jgi:hypothetical protein